MHSLVRPSPNVAGEEPSSGLVPAGNLDPGVKLALRDVFAPGEEEPPEVVIPLLARELFLEITPGLVGFDDVGDAAVVHGPVLDLDCRIAYPHRLGLVV